MISNYFPNSSIIFSDFEFFPDDPDENDEKIILPYKNIPRIHHTKNGKSIIYDNYLKPGKYNCDIYFPTNFIDFKILYEKIFNNNKSEIIRNSDFIKKYSTNYKQLTTKNGYNPILDDYNNTCFFLS